MLGVIPNPKKSHTLDFPIQQMNLAVERVCRFSTKYKLTKSNPVFNQTTLEAFEFLSLGVFIDISLSSVGDNKTEITIEVRRKIGSFDQSYEVTNANKHLDNLFDLLAKVIVLSDTEFEEFIEEETQKVVKGKKSSRNTWLIVFGIIFFVLFLLSKWGPFY
jgi:hypothetical protein